MTWPHVPLKDGTPAESSCIKFQPEEKVWLLTLHDRRDDGLVCSSSQRPQW